MSESLSEYPMDYMAKALEVLNEGRLLNTEELLRLSNLVQVNYLDALPVWEDEDKEDNRVDRWFEASEGGAATFRLLWNENPTPEGGEEGFRDLCLKALKETEPKRKREIFEEMSQRIGDKLF